MNLKVGDKVVIDVSQESSSWGAYPEVKNGEIGEVISFSEIHYGRTRAFGKKPGVYQNTCWPLVRMESGLELTINSCYVKPLLPEEHPYNSGDFIRDLPETLFWEEDMVEDQSGEIYRIDSIDYAFINEKINDGSPWPFYTCAPLGCSWTIQKTEASLKLIKRGNVWKHFHSEKLAFSSIEEEANFFKSLGLYDEVKNPANNLYSWNLQEILEAIKNDIVDGFSVGHMLFSDKVYHSAIRFHDRNLGKRVAEATLKGFSK